MAKPGETGIKRIFSAACYSIRGLIACWQYEAAFRQELLVIVFLFPAAILLGKDNVEKAILLSSCILVLIVEILNSAIEAVVDRIGHEHHVLSGRAKDMGSAAVMLSLGTLALVWGLVLLG